MDLKFSHNSKSVALSLGISREDASEIERIVCDIFEYKSGAMITEIMESCIHAVESIIPDFHDGHAFMVAYTIGNYVGRRMGEVAALRAMDDIFGDFLRMQLVEED